MINDLLKAINTNTKLEDEVNLKKAKILEDKKPSTKEVIYYFKEKDLGFIKEGFEEADLEDLYKIKPYTAKRSLLEYLPSQRHPIPYCIVKHDDKYFLIFRENGSGESRLIGKKGLLGGHVGIDDSFSSNIDLDIISTIENGMLRELEEEAGITECDISDIDFKGFIKIVKENEVENDHLGVIYLINLKHFNISTLEEGILSGDWFTKEEILNNMDSLENWSKLIFKKIL